MNRNYIFRDVTEALPVLLDALLEEGDDVVSRAGLTKEFTHVGITLREPWRRELLVAHRKPNIAAQIAETAWILAGRDDIGWLKHYLPRAADFSDDGLVWRAAYGPRLQKQLGYVVDLLRRDPTSRQAVISLWDPEVDSKPGKDIACNNWLHFLSRKGRLHLHVSIRSNDIIWGWSGINTFEWSVLLEIVAKMTNLTMGSIHFSVSSEHIYEQHWDRARRIVAADPTLNDDLEGPFFTGGGAHNLGQLDILLKDWFDIEAQIRRGKDCMEQIRFFPEPMLQSWLYILQWWWTGNPDALRPIAGTRLAAATHYSIQPPDGSPFIRDVIALHTQKSAAYGDSWCRRGEKLGILANIARKVDRLGTGKETADETSLDTAIDLLVYLAKYRAWISGDASTEAGNKVLSDLDTFNPTMVEAGMFDIWFNDLEHAVENGADKASKAMLVGKMMRNAYALAFDLWSRQ